MNAAGGAVPPAACRQPAPAPRDERRRFGEDDCAVYRLDPALPRPAVIVYALDNTFRIVTEDWKLDLHLDVPASVTKAALEAAANQL